MGPLLGFLLATGLCASAYGTQLAWTNAKRLPTGSVLKNTDKKVKCLRIGPAICVVSALLATIVVPLTAKADGLPCTSEDEEINPDIGGIGVLLGIFSPCGVLILVLVLGHFSTENSGAKELCMAQCANLTYLAVNLAKGMPQLNSREITIAISSIDAVSASISMSFANKDVLAARKLVAVGFVMQLVAFAVEGAALHVVTQRATLACGLIGSQPFRSISRSSSWVYFTFRMTVAILPAGVALRLSSILNKIENRSSRSQNISVKAKKVWTKLPATFSTNYLAFSSFVILHGMSVTMIVRETNTIGRSWKTLCTEWGQSANAIVAMFAICHVVYVCSRLFSDSHHLNPGTGGGVHDHLVLPPNSSGVDQRSSRMSLIRPWTQQSRRLQRFRMRWPFRLLQDAPDYLIVDDSELRMVLSRPQKLSSHELDSLWDDLLLSFRLKEKELIVNLVDQGAPLDRQDEDGNYPIHLAAALYDDPESLDKFLFRPETTSNKNDCLLLQNPRNHTPLIVAGHAKMYGAVHWIMANLPRENEATAQCVRTAFETAIDENGMLKVLDILTYRWPTWHTLEDRERPQGYFRDSPVHIAFYGREEKNWHLFYYAIEHSRTEAASLLLSKLHFRNKFKIPSGLMDLACATLNRRLIYRIMEGDLGTISTWLWKNVGLDERDTGRVLGSELIPLASHVIEHMLKKSMSTDDVLKLGEVLSIPLYLLLEHRIAVYQAPSVIMPHMERPDLWQRLAQITATLRPATRKSVLASLAIPSEPLQAPNTTDFTLLQLELALNRKDAPSHMRNLFVLLAAYSGINTKSDALQIICSNMHEDERMLSESYDQITILLLLGADPRLTDSEHHTPRQSFQATWRSAKPDSKEGAYAKYTDKLLMMAEDYYETQGESNALIPTNGKTVVEKIKVFLSFELLERWPSRKALEYGNITWLDKI